MIPTIIIDKKTKELQSFETQIKNVCPELAVMGSAECKTEYESLFKDTGQGIVFINPQIIPEANVGSVKSLGLDKVFICMANQYQFAKVATYWQAAGYLLKPTNSGELKTAVQTAREIISKNKEEERKEKLLQDLLKKSRADRLIGIPTVDGYEIILVDNIIRCEGLQKCTRIVTTDKKDIVSSHSIGRFRRILQKFGGFFSPHRSYLINLIYTCKYRKAGELIMRDGSTIPLAKSKKEEFLYQINLL